MGILSEKVRERSGNEKWNFASHYEVSPYHQGTEEWGGPRTCQEKRPVRAPFWGNSGISFKWYRNEPLWGNPTVKVWAYVQSSLRQYSVAKITFSPLRNANIGKLFGWKNTVCWYFFIFWGTVASVDVIVPPIIEIIVQLNLYFKTGSFKIITSFNGKDVTFATLYWQNELWMLSLEDSFIMRFCSGLVWKNLWVPPSRRTFLTHSLLILISWSLKLDKFYVTILTSSMWNILRGNIYRGVSIFFLVAFVSVPRREWSIIYICPFENRLRIDF